MNPGLLALFQRLSPGFPVGGYAYSHGLEWAIDRGDVRDADGLFDWLTDVLAEGTGWNDALIMAHAMGRDADIPALADLSRALFSCAERRRESEEQGRAYGDVLGQEALPYPVALGLSCRDLDLPVATVLAFYLQAFAANLVQAAVRFVPLGAADGQGVLTRLQPLILRLADQAAAAPLTALASGGFRSDLAAMAHETMEVRIFRT